MLRLLHHLVCVLAYNSQPVRKLITVPSKGRHNWEQLGLSLNNTAALLNHSCDPNAFYFHTGDSIDS